MPSKNRVEVKKRKPNRKTFTDLMLKRLKPKSRQYLVWDVPSRQGGQLGLSVLVSPGSKARPRGTKTFRATYYLNGKAISKKLGRVGELSLGKAREQTKDLRGTAAEGKDPKEEERKKRLEKAKAKTYGKVARMFIDQVAKPWQRTWDQTERFLLKTCEAWLDRPIGEITRGDAYALLDSIEAEGHRAKADKTFVWLRTMWRWAYQRELVAEPLFDAIIHKPVKRVRNPFKDILHPEQRAKKIADDIRAIWKAAESLSRPEEEAYIKVLVLLAPRKTALAEMRVAHLNLGHKVPIWTVPADETKGYRKRNPDAAKAYITPLPKMAKEILKPLLPEGVTDEFVFKSVQDGKRLNPSGPLQRKLIKAGAPADFNYHAMRHYISTWLEDQGHSVEEGRMVLNHASNNVTTGYRHGDPRHPKMVLLSKWAKHIESLVG